MSMSFKFTCVCVCVCVYSYLYENIFRKFLATLLQEMFFVEGTPIIKLRICNLSARVLAINFLT
jgi:hypothetical protein